MINELEWLDSKITIKAFDSEIDSFCVQTKIFKTILISSYWEKNVLKIYDFNGNSIMQYNT